MIGRRESRAIRRPGFLATAIVIALTLASSPVRVHSAAQDPRNGRPLGDFSPALLGTYRKVMRVERELDSHARRYGVDRALARAVCMFESGGNPDLTSSAGARGLFQVMPSTFRLMRVATNIEAGIKYLGQMVKLLGTEDYALAAYNGGPGRVARRLPMPLESLQYVIGVGIYREALRAHEPDIRRFASELQATRAVEGDSWQTVADRVRVPAVQLRLHNPFLAERPLRPGVLIVHPSEPRPDLFASSEASTYRTRIGDNYLTIARTLGIAPDVMRRENGLWRLQPTMPGMVLTIPRAPAPPLTSRKHSVVHLVRRGDTLAGIARRYGTSVKALQAANQLGRQTTIRPGQAITVGD